MSNRFAIIIIVLIALFCGVFVVSKKKADAPTNNSTANSAKVSSHTLGDNTKKVTLVEYGDFQCPACTAYHPIIKQVVDKYKADISFQFVNYPLVQIHPNAMAAHRAAEAAAQQNKYWEMHDLLYEQHDSWANASGASAIFEGYASQLGLNVSKFKSDASSSNTNDIIQADLKKGQGLGVSATPTFYLNGKKLDEPPRDVDGFSKLLDDAIKAAATS